MCAESAASHAKPPRVECGDVAVLLARWCAASLIEVKVETEGDAVQPLFGL